MIGPVVLDTGPMVAVLRSEEVHHQWVRETFAQIRPPLLTCEAVISESLFLLQRHGGEAQGVMALIQQGVVSLPFSLADDSENVQHLLQRYSDLPMSLADACLVRLAERTRGAQVLTFDRHFEIYRLHRNRPIPTLMPPR